MRKLVMGAMIFLFSAGSSPAPVMNFLKDDCDDVWRGPEFYTQEEVVQAGKKLNEFEKKLQLLKQKDFVALFGKSQDRPANTYAIPVSCGRVFWTSGLGFGAPDDRRHTDFYIVKDVAALEVHYGFNGESPAVIIVYFCTDRDFPKLAKDNLAKRLAWEEAQLKRFMAFYEKRSTEVFPWEIDQKDLRNLQQGDFAAAAKTKLDAWIESGKKLGYLYEHKEGSNDWNWYLPSGNLARSAHRGANEGPPIRFIWYQEDGSHELRREIFNYHTGELTSRCWCRPGTTESIRNESTNNWWWYDKEGNVVRREWDDNGDGIPDWYMTNEDFVGDKKEVDLRKPLKVEKSWAINPKLIPEESRISDQPELRVPIRRKVD
jgi:hypothetical protein